MAQCVVSRAMIETNQERACCVVARPPALDESDGGRPPRTKPRIMLRSCRSTLATIPGGRGEGAHWSGTLRLSWARTVDSHGRGIADPNFWRCRRGEGLLPAISFPIRRNLPISRDAESVHHSPNALCLALLPRVPAHCVASIDALYIHVYQHANPTKRTAAPKHWFN